jgi:hypothetical protein
MPCWVRGMFYREVEEVEEVKKVKNKNFFDFAVNSLIR